MGRPSSPSTNNSSILRQEVFDLSRILKTLFSYYTSKEFRFQRCNLVDQEKGQIVAISQELVLRLYSVQQALNQNLKDFRASRLSRTDVDQLVYVFVFFFHATLVAVDIPRSLCYHFSLTQQESQTAETTLSEFPNPSIMNRFGFLQRLFSGYRALMEAHRGRTGRFHPLAFNAFFVDQSFKEHRKNILRKNTAIAERHFSILKLVGDYIDYPDADGECVLL